MNNGYIKLHRCLLNHPRSSDPEYVSIWIRMLLLATHTEVDKMFGGERIRLRPGQFITSRSSLARQCGVSASKIERVLKWMKIEQQIEQRSSSVSRLITIVNWRQYQTGEQQSEHISDSERTASGQRANTNNKERREECKKKEDTPLNPPRGKSFVRPTLREVSAYCLERGSIVDPVQWFDHYTANGWKVGRNSMKDWKAAVRTWEKRNTSEKDQYGLTEADWGEVLGNGQG